MVFEKKGRAYRILNMVEANLNTHKTHKVYSKLARKICI